MGIVEKPSNPQDPDKRKIEWFPSCDHDEEEEPCSRCRPLGRWVMKGRTPHGWKHVPWDIIELKRHGRVKVESQPEVEDVSPVDETPPLRSTLVGQESQSYEASNWPQTPTTRLRVDRDDEVPPPPKPSSYVSSQETEAAAGRSSAQKRSSRTRRAARRSQKLGVRRKRGKRSVSVRVKLRVRVSKKKRGDRGEDETMMRSRKR